MMWLFNEKLSSVKEKIFLLLFFLAAIPIFAQSHSFNQNKTSFAKETSKYLVNSANVSDESFYKSPPAPPPAPPANTNISGIINKYAAVTNINICSNNLTVDNSSDFSVNDTVLIVQMKGAEMNLTNTAAFGNLVNLNNAGNYEYNIIMNIAGNVITFEKVFEHPYDPNGKVQIVSVPNYNGDVTVTALLTASPWNGAKGGILVFNATGDLTLNANIDVTKLGFRGGTNIVLPAASYTCNFFVQVTNYFYPNGTQFSAGKGEGLVNYIAGYESGRGKNLNGGGGGNDHNSGGGGGAGYGNGGIGGENNEPANFGCKGKYPGVGGVALDSVSRFLFSGGGGSGHGNGYVSFGGKAGGLIFISANSIIGNSNSILADGQIGDNGVVMHNDGAGGGGGGGSIFINSSANTDVLFSAKGGKGGNMHGDNSARCQGPGGGGGGGLIYAVNTSGNTFDVSGGSNGIITNSTSPNGCNGSSSGALSGSLGKIVNTNYASISLPAVTFIPLYPITINDPADTLYACQGSNVKMFIDTTGCISPTDFQWQILNAGVWTNLNNGGSYAGTNTDTLRLNMITQIMNNEMYRVLVYNICDSVYSDAINLKVSDESIINSQPQDTTVCSGNNAAFVINASGIVSFNWQNNEGGTFVNLTNNATYSGVSTDSLYIVSATNVLDGVDFRVQMLDECGNTTFSSVATITVSNAISITDFSSDISLCSSSDTLMFVTTSSEATSYQWQVNTGSGFINLTNGLNYSNVTNDTLNLSNIPFSFNGNIYRANVTDACGTNLNSNLINLTVYPNSTTSVIDSICANSNYTLPSGIIVNAAGIYLDTLVNTYGCDSIITTNLFVNAASTSNVNDTICANEMYTLPNGMTTNTTGIYVDTLPSITGCDSIITTNLIVNPLSNSSVNDTICTNTNYTLPSGIVVNAAGVYLDTLANINGCDSVITTNLFLNPVSTSTVNETICSNATYTLPNGSIVNATGIYLDTLSNINGCDSIVTTNLVVNLISTSIINDTICATETYTLPDGTIVNTTGTYIDTLSNSNTCDSIITTNLFVAPVSLTTVNDTICANTTYTLPNGGIVNTAGTYIDTLSNVNGCATVVTTNLSVIANVNITLAPSDTSVCQNNDALFYVQATGTNLEYQWQGNNGLGFIDIPGETNDSLKIANVSQPINLDGFEFRVVLNSYCGNVINSDSAVLSILNNVALTSNPLAAEVCAGNDTSFTVTTNGNQSTIQWQVDSGTGFTNLVNNTNYSGVNTLSLNVLNPTFGFDGNNYRVIVSDNCGISDTSNIAALTVNPIVEINMQPVNVNECLGNDALYFVNASNANTYQWQINTGSGFVNIAGATNDTLILSAVDATMNGNQYQCLISNNCNSLTTDIVDLSVSTAAVVIAEPSDVVICPEGLGSSFYLFFDVQNVSVFQWQIDTGLGFQNVTNTLNFNGAKSNKLTVSAPFNALDGAKFRLTYTDNCGLSTTSNVYNVSLNEPDPVIGIGDLTRCLLDKDLIEVDYDGTNYVWNDAAQTTGRFFFPEASGTYIVSFVQNSTSCFAYDTVNIILEDCLDKCIVTAPTGFSPDANGVNDRFKIIYTCPLDNYELIIANRWGETVFFSNDPKQAWDGTYKNKPAPIGTYIWAIQYNKKGGSKQQSLSGNVMLIR